MRNHLLLVLGALFVLTACGSNEHQPSAYDTPGPLGIPGYGWFILIMMAIVFIGGSLGGRK